MMIISDLSSTVNNSYKSINVAIELIWTISDVIQQMR